ncbi:MAG: B12-binding domain-containing protein [Actinomycetota bacterium]|nr:B12-binding domain-containing protein [Actinomycetota bacterium]
MSGIDKVREGLVNLEIENIQPVTREALDAGAAPLDIALEGLGNGMKQVGDLFQSGEYYLADLVLAGETMKEAMKMLDPLVTGEARAEKGPVVLFAVKGDIHDIGKILVSTVLFASGFNVKDLGVDVTEDQVVDAVKGNGASLVGMSVLLSPMIGSLGDVVDALKEAGLRNSVKIAIGGACTSPELLEKFGLDAMGKDAVDAVRIFEGWYDQGL